MKRELHPLRRGIVDSVPRAGAVVMSRQIYRVNATALRPPDGISDRFGRNTPRRSVAAGDLDSAPPIRRARTGELATEFVDVVMDGWLETGAGIQQFSIGFGGPPISLTLARNRKCSRAPYVGKDRDSLRPHQMQINRVPRGDHCYSRENSGR
jgi:hypothetical protein